MTLIPNFLHLVIHQNASYVDNRMPAITDAGVLLVYFGSVGRPACASPTNYTSTYENDQQRKLIDNRIYNTIFTVANVSVLTTVGFIQKLLSLLLLILYSLEYMKENEYPYYPFLPTEIYCRQISFKINNGDQQIQS